MSLKQTVLALVAAIILSQAALRCAHAEPDYEVVLEDTFGNRLNTYAHRGQVFAMGRMGQRYNVRVINHSGRRVEAVVSVDGRDVITGKPGDFKRLRGYVVAAHDSTLIEGFRTSDAHVAAFRFTTPGDSYSSRMGSPENVGVIGAAFFPERRVPRRRRPVYQPSDDGRATRGRGLGSQFGSGAPAAEAAPAAPQRSQRKSSRSAAADAESDASNIGTQYGEQRYSRVHSVDFRRARENRPARVVTLRYDDERGLLARGIVTRPRPRPRPLAGPAAFPANRYAPPPPPHTYR